MEAIINARIYTEDKVIQNGYIEYDQAVALGVDDRIGSISLGKQADFVLIDNEFNVLSTVKKGYNIYNNKK